MADRQEISSGNEVVRKTRAPEIPVHVSTAEKKNPPKFYYVFTELTPPCNICAHKFFFSLPVTHKASTRVWRSTSLEANSPYTLSRPFPCNSFFFSFFFAAPTHLHPCFATKTDSCRAAVAARVFACFPCPVQLLVASS